MDNHFIITRALDGKFFGYGHEWVPEYADARLFDRLSDAVKHVEPHTEYMLIYTTERYQNGIGPVKFLNRPRSHGGTA